MAAAAATLRAKICLRCKTRTTTAALTAAAEDENDASASMLLEAARRFRHLLEPERSSSLEAACVVFSSTVTAFGVIAY